MNKRQAKKLLKKANKKRRKGLLAVYAKCDCGCCTEELLFKNRAAAEEAFRQAGMNNSATITDDAGVEHQGIDTFYGFSFQEQEAEERSLGYLFKKTFGV